jgi:tetratricopeptide (TPR) repeat protein
MQRSGLAMSGANACLDKRGIPPEAGTGSIFAADIQQLDLQRTDLVVLSACRSGLGDIAVGDGAHGLRRAFLAAGARSVLSALWDVPDDSSKTLVTQFFEQLLNKVPRVDALAAAREVVRKAHPGDPIHWAGFVLDGSFGPLGRFSPLSDLKIANVPYLMSSKDPERMARIAKQIRSDPELDETYLTSVISLKRVVGRPDVPDNARVIALMRLADLANRLGDNVAAIRWYREVLHNEAAEPGERIAVSYNIAKTLHMSGDLAAGINAYTELLTQQHLDAEIRSHALVNRGFAYSQLQRFGDGVADFTAVLTDEEAPPDQQFMARLNRAAALYDMGDAKNALDDIDVVLKSDQATDIDKLTFRISRAQMLIDLGRRETALAEIEDLSKVPELSEETRDVVERLRVAAT